MINKIKINDTDYQCHGLGHNNYNFCNNVLLKFSTWILSEYNNLLYKNFEEQDRLVEKLKKIVDIINEEEK